MAFFMPLATDECREAAAEKFSKLASAAAWAFEKAG
jgi:hypothetical protein